MAREPAATGIRKRSRGVVLRLLASIGIVGVGWLAVVTKAAHDEGSVDEAGVVLIGICALAVVAVSWRLWARGGVQFALAGVDIVSPRADLPAPTGAPAKSEDDVILVDDVTVRYGIRIALDHVSLRVGRGEIVALLGPNGAGKTTTVDVCCGLRKPDAGHASILGLTSTSPGRELRRAIGVVPQETGLYPELTAAEYLRLFAAMYELKRRSPRIEELLHLMGLWERRNTRVAGFSGGMKRRLALARALLHSPPVLFLDEPTLGVDVQGRRALWEHVRGLRDEGRSVLLTTNYLEEATALCDRVVILDEGVVLADARPAELRSQGGITLLLETAQAEVVAAALQARFLVPVAIDAESVVVSLSSDQQAADVVRMAASVADITAIRTELPTLEDVFLSLTGRELRE